MDTETEPDNSPQHRVQDNKDALHRLVSFGEMGARLLF